MLEKKTFAIDGDVYTFMPMPATKARAYLISLISRFGPAWAKALDGGKEIKLDSATLKMDHLDPALLASFLPSIASSLSGFIDTVVRNVDSAYYTDLCETFLSRVSVEKYDVETGETLNPQLLKQYRDIHFATKLKLESQILFNCLRMQYSDFFEWYEKGKILVESYLTQVMAKYLISQKVSIGGSGELSVQKE